MVIKQRYGNDCAVAAVAMALRLPYRQVLNVAVYKCNFKPGARYGLDIATLVYAVGYDLKFFGRFPGHRGSYHRKIKRLNIPMIVSIKSLNNRGGYHAVMVCRSVVYDPSSKRTANFDYVSRNWHNCYFGFVRDDH